MKITIAYTDGEERKAKLIQRFACAMFDGAEVWYEANGADHSNEIYLSMKEDVAKCDANTGCKGLNSTEGLMRTGSY